MKLLSRILKQPHNFQVTPAVTPIRNSTITVSLFSPMFIRRNTVTKHPKQPQRNSGFLKEPLCYGQLRRHLRSLSGVVKSRIVGLGKGFRMLPDRLKSFVVAALGLAGFWVLGRVFRDSGASEGLCLDGGADPEALSGSQSVPAGCVTVPWLQAADIYPGFAGSDGFGRTACCDGFPNEARFWSQSGTLALPVAIHNMRYRTLITGSQKRRIS